MHMFHMSAVPKNLKLAIDQRLGSVAQWSSRPPPEKMNGGSNAMEGARFATLWFKT
jgi:hypothetical protein